MATTNMSTVTRQILEKMGDETGVITVRTNGSDIKPGHIVTKTGETINTPDVDLVGATDDITLGVVLNEPNQDIDTAYGDNESINVAVIGSGCVCWVWAQANCGDLRVGQPVYTTGSSNDGFVVPWTLTSAPASDTYTTAAMQTELDKVDLSQLQYVGRVWQDASNDASNDRPILVKLV